MAKAKWCNELGCEWAIARWTDQRIAKLKEDGWYFHPWNGHIYCPQHNPEKIEKS